VLPPEKSASAVLVHETAGPLTFAPLRSALRIFVPRSYTPIHTVNNGENVAVPYAEAISFRDKIALSRTATGIASRAFLPPILGGRLIIPASRPTTTTTTFFR
jgi:hypothetical protein